MFGLTEQVDRAQFTIYGLVRNDKRLGWSSEQVDTNAPEQLPFGFGHKSIARSYQHIDTNGLGANRHRPDGLNTTEDVIIGSSQVLGRDNSRGRLPRTVVHRSRYAAPQQPWR